jgi:alpha-N-acetylglucosaminidase
MSTEAFSMPFPLFGAFYVIRTLSTCSICVVIFALYSPTCRAEIVPSNPIAAARSLVSRVLPAHAGEFSFEMISAEGSKDVFEIDAKSGKIVLRGNSALSIAVAFNWYLHYQVKAGYDWQADQPLSVPGSLPVPPKKIHQVCMARDRFFLNYCTFGYTFPFMGYPEWQRFIDWMAMNGINHPLLQCGQEATWLKVWESYGLSDEQIRAYFTGPAHLPWHRMTNIDKWAGPLPTSYIDGQRDLQIKILAQARELGMTPILSGFSGHVPEALKSAIANVAITRIPGAWAGFDSAFGTWFLAPADPLFKDIQVRFLKEQSAMYGTDHLYAIDPFNEITPPSWDPQYLAQVAHSIYDGMVAGDPDAKWYQMSWTFNFKPQWLKADGGAQTPFAAMTTSVPVGKLIYLDYFGEEHEMYNRTDMFAGAPFIWNYLGNFGGSTYMSAPLARVTDRIAKALKVPNCVGVGSTLEGINTNPIIYEMTFEQPWHADGTIDLPRWADQYAERRCGWDDPAVVKAWGILRDQLLDSQQPIHASRNSAVTDTPGFEDISEAKPNPKDFPPITPAEQMSRLAGAIDALSGASDRSQTADGYQYDVVNFVRQYLTDEGDDARERMFAAYNRQDLAAFRTEGARLLGDIRDLDQLVGTRHEYLLGTWIHDARRWASSPAEGNFYERNARLIVSSWGAPGGDLTDYARREWNGLLETYYFPRWEAFIKQVDASLAAKTKFDEPTYTKWRIQFDTDWVDSTKEQFAVSPTGNPVELAKSIFARHRTTN